MPVQLQGYIFPPRHHPGTRTVQRMLWLCLTALLPFMIFNLAFGYTLFLLAQTILLVALGSLILINRDSLRREARTASGFWAIISAGTHSYFSGPETGMYLFLPLITVGLIQTYTFAKRDPWLLRLQILSIMVLLAILLIDALGISGTYLQSEHIYLMRYAVIGSLGWCSIFLLYMFRVSAEKQLQAASVEVDDFMKLFSTSPNALIISDPLVEQCEAYNANFLQLLGYKNEEEPPRTIAELFDPPLRPAEYRAIIRALERKENWSVDRKLVTARGDTISCRVVFSPLRLHTEDRALVRAYDNRREQSIMESLERTQERLELALQASQDGIWEWDLEANTVYLSPRWKEMLGYRDSELANDPKTWRRLILEEDQEPSIRLMKAFIRQKVDTFRIVERYHHKEGKVIFVESRAARVVNEEGRTIKVVGSHTDITALVQAENKLRDAMHRAESANEAKSQFLANMSHEIRTPLSTILGFTEQLLKQDLDREVRELISYIDISGKTLNRLLVDILDFEQMRRGKLQLNDEPFNPKNLVTELSKVYQRRAASKGIHMMVETNWAEGQIWGDTLRFRQIVVNLLENAFKFTEAGAIRLSLLLDTQSAENRLCLSVSDTGPGIPKDLHDTIFEAFTQQDSTFARKHPGSGLGLGIVKQLVSLMEGVVSVESPPEVPIPGYEQGTRFRVQLPVRKAPRTEVPSPETPARKHFARQTVLLAEDNPLNLRLARHALKKFDLQVITAHDGGEAISRVKAHPEIDLVLMDVMMPYMDGYEACRQIKKLRQDLPVVGLSAHAYPTDIKRSREAGMDDYLAKPYSEDQLFGVLARWFPEEIQHPLPGHP